MKKLKICLVQSEQNPHIIRWANALTGRGHTVKILPIYQYDLGFMMGCSARTQVEESRWQKTKKHLDWVARWRAKKRAFDPDVVHLHEPMGTVDEYLSLLGIKNLIVSVWGTEVSQESFDQSGRLKNAIKKSVLRKAKYVTATSPFLVECTRQWIARKPIEVIPFGVDIDQVPVRRSVSAPGHCRIGFLKGFMERYRPDLFIKALAVVKAHIPGAKAVMGGWSMPECREEMIRLARSLNIADRIEIIDLKPHNEIIALLSKLDLNVICSDFESFGVMAIESLAAGVPVIATNVGGLQQLVVDGETGFVVPPNDHQALADRMIKILSSNELNTKMGIAGRRFVKEKYLWADNVSEMEQLYLSIK